MKITKRNCPPEKRIWKGICSNCRSEAEAEQKELTGIIHDQRDGKEFSWEICPVCDSGPYGGMLFHPPKEA